MNNRRRILRIVALAGGMGLSPKMALADHSKTGFFKWEGSALGAEASIQLYSENTSKTDKVLKNAAHLIKKHEKKFSLYDSGSELSRLNRQGYLENPSGEFMELTEKAIDFYRATDGAFDVTIQPLWEYYSRYFNGSSSEFGFLEAASLTGSDKIILAHDRISFAKHGMGISFNGIAQGYITDKVSEYLKSEGFENVLVDVGEFRAIGPQTNGEPWRVGLLDPSDGVSLADIIEMDDGAMATSGGYGNQFDSSGKFHHLFDPKTGMSSNLYASVTVSAQDATTADALSTAFSNMDVQMIGNTKKEYSKVVVRLTGYNGDVRFI